jgi:ribosome-associated translation inhibitor RaiA
MTINFNTDHNTIGNEKLDTYFSSLLEKKIERFSAFITRLEVHLSDENEKKDGVNDKRCMLEARIEGRQPIAVTNHANTYEKSISGAIDKLLASLETIQGRMKNH